jgi:uncharacterized glyoxalase superfamily protein PhnB
MSLQFNSLTPLIQVFDMPRSVGFYRDVLGFEVTDTSAEVEAPEGRHFQWALLKHGPAAVMLNTAYDVGERPAALAKSVVVAHGDTCLYLGCPDVDAAYDLLKSKGAAQRPPKVTAYGMKQLYLRDPDGYAVCLQQAAS